MHSYATLQSEVSLRISGGVCSSVISCGVSLPGATEEESILLWTLISYAVDSSAIVKPQSIGVHPQANGYQIDFDDWHAAVHGTLPYEWMLQEDKAMRQLLQSIDLPKFVFTNADSKHAETCLRLLGIADLFQVRRLAAMLIATQHIPSDWMALGLRRAAGGYYIHIPDVPQAVQGVICFESLMEEGRKRGIVKDNKPIICKPNRVVSMAICQPHALSYSDRHHRAAAVHGCMSVASMHTPLSHGLSQPVVLDLGGIAWRLCSPLTSLGHSDHGCCGPGIPAGPGGCPCSGSHHSILRRQR